MTYLTKAEEQVMQKLWDLKKGFLKEIVGKFPEPRPATTTISTVLRKLVDKEAVTIKNYGKIHEYTPAITRENYSKSRFNQLIEEYFNNSPTQFASFFSSKINLTIAELEEVRDVIERIISRQKTTERK